MPTIPDADDLFGGLTYQQAVELLLADPTTSYTLRQRILEDAQRDAVDSLNEAEVLMTMQRLRFESATQPLATQQG